MYSNILNFVVAKCVNSDLKGYDPYDLMSSKLINSSLRCNRVFSILSQVNRISPINIRKFLGIRKSYNTKSISLFALGFSYFPNFKYYFQHLISLLEKLKINKSNKFLFSSDFRICLSHHNPQKGKPDLIISLFSGYAFIQYYKIFQDKKKLDSILALKQSIEQDLPQFENDNILWYSYNFEKVNEIYNATAKIGKFYSLLYPITKDKALLIKIDKILNYLAKKQRDDGSWGYGENISYTDGFHTAFVLEAIWYMRKVVDNQKFIEMFYRGLKHYRKYLFNPNGQPLYFHPNYKPRDIRRFLIETDIRDCAMAIVFFSKIGEKEMAEKVLEWTLNNMYNDKKGYFYYFKNRLFTNKVEFIRWQAWMLYALSVYMNEIKKFK